MEELFETIGDILVIEYMATLEASNAEIEASNANIETSEFDKTIRETAETKNVIVDDIVFGRTRAMWWSTDHHIERGV